MGRREKPVDPGAGPVQRFAYELRELREKAGKPPYREMAGRAGYSITAMSQAAAGEQLPSLAVVRAYAEALDADPEEWERRWRDTDALLREPAPDERPPYRGLARFEADDSDLFFGRDALVSEAVELVRGHRFAAVFGPSGSGKSSLLRAGLIPRLRQEEGDRRPAVIRVLTPGERPASAHEKALVPRDGDLDTWVIVDQFEELFTLCSDRGERDRFLDLLLASRRPESRLRVVIAVRGDFYGHCAGHRDLADAVCRASLLVGPMTRDELREVITGPAATAGLNVERALTSRVVDEVVDRPGALPMLSHALLETWRRRRARLLTLAAYEETGGVQGAIAATAEHVYGELPPDRARTARRILLRLIAPGDGTADTRRPASRAELGDGAPEVLEHLADARLVTLDGDTVELAHEALITGWPRLTGWIEEDRDRLRAQRGLGEAARGWADLAHDPGALYRGARLARAEELFALPPDDDLTALAPGDGTAPAPDDDLTVPVPGSGTAPAPDGDLTVPVPGSGTAPAPDDDLTPAERSFLTASLAARETERQAENRTLRRTRSLIVGLSAVLVLALVAGLIAWERDRVSQEEAAKAAARRVAAVADGLRSTDPRTAALLGVAAWRIAPLTESRSALLGALAQPQRDAFTDPRSSNDVRRFLTDGGRTLLSVDGATVTLWNVAAHRATATHRLPTGTEVAGAGPGSAYLDVIGPDGAEKLWNLPRDASAAELGGTALQSSAPDGSAYLTGPVDGPGTVRLHRTSDGETLFTTGLPRTLSAAAVGPGGRLLALCPADGPLQLWDTARGKRLTGDWEKTDRLLCGTGSGADNGTRQLRFSADGKRLAAVYGTTVRVWDVRGGRTLDEFASAQDAGFTEAGLSPDGEFLATSDGRELAVWRLATGGTQIFRQPLAGADTAGLTWDPGGRHLLRYLDGATVHTLDLADSLGAPWHSAATDSGVLSPDGATLATLARSGDGYRFDLLSTRTGAVLAHSSLGTLPGQSGGEVPLLAFSPEGRELAVADTYSAHGSLRLRLTVWDVRAHKARTVLDTSGAADRPATALALGPGGRTLLVARASTDDHMTEVWDVRRRRQTATLRGLSGQTLAVRPDGDLVVGSDGQYADPDSAKVTGRALADGRDVTALAFSPDGTLLAVGDGTGHVTFWDGGLRDRTGALTGTADTVSQGEPEAVKALAFSADGATLAVGGSGGTLRLWDTAGGQPLGGDQPTPGDGITSLAFTPDTATLYATSPHVPLWHLPLAPKQAIHTICARTGGGLSEAQWRTYVPDAPYRKLC
ncbi:helix-turn-helix domain-containing protein [Streptomyces sp. NPDC004539]|uniref:nSTAND1 domain-containing NTPase n=1 Tax=Streptomyces sp. NPDC004539 TaxID=3154280 RepID=UPI0033B4B210